MASRGNAEPERANAGAATRIRTTLTRMKRHRERLLNRHVPSSLNPMRIVRVLRPSKRDRRDVSGGRNHWTLRRRAMNSLIESNNLSGESDRHDASAPNRARNANPRLLPPRPPKSAPNLVTSNLSHATNEGSRARNAPHHDAKSPRRDQSLRLQGLSHRPVRSLSRSRHRARLNRSESGPLPRDRQDHHGVDPTCPELLNNDR